jgi:two-component system, chemotaxis family, response regulator WspF
MRVAIANDSPMAVEALRRVLAGAPEHRLAWVAADGVEAVERAARDRPDLILMDLMMPRMGGVEATRRIMAQSPCAILVVTADIENHAPHVFAAMSEGALDAVDTPLLAGAEGARGSRALLGKIAALGRLIVAGPASLAPAAAPLAGVSTGVVAIGASAGGPGALATVLQGLPRDFPAGVVIVQHVDARFAPGLTDWLGHHSTMPVRLAQEGERVAPGQVLVAGTQDHLVFRAGGHLAYASEPADHAYRPSIDVMLRSAGQHWSGPLAGVLLTGMGADGAQGLRVLRDMGHPTIAQDQATSAVYGMPKAAAALGAASDILPLDRIAARLIDLMGPAGAARARVSTGRVS